MPHALYRGTGKHIQELLAMRTHYDEVGPDGGAVRRIPSKGLPETIGAGRRLAATPAPRESAR